MEGVESWVGKVAGVVSEGSMVGVDGGGAVEVPERVEEEEEEEGEVVVVVVDEEIPNGSDAGVWRSIPRG